MSNRIFYASQAVSIAATNGSPTAIQGAQSVTIATSYKVDKYNQLGHTSVLNSIAMPPEVEVTITKNLDGSPTMFGTYGATLVGLANTQKDIYVGVGDDTALELASGAAIKMTGCYLKSVKYAMQIEGAFTEECSFVGGDKQLSGTLSAPTTSGAKVLTRRNFAGSTLPSEVAGLKIQSVSISADLGREALYELGNPVAFFRSPTFPAEITCEISVLAQAASDETAFPEGSEAGCDTDNLPLEQPISIVLCDAGSGSGYTFNLGDKCILQSVNYSGGDTGGGNVTITYSYTTSNSLTVTN